MKYLKLKNSVHTKELKSKNINPICIVLAAMAFFYSYIYYNKWHATTLAIICLTGGSLSLLVAVINRIKSIYYIAANAATLLFFGVMTVMAIYAGGIESNSIWWLGTVPLIATFLLNTGFGLIWFGIVILDFIVILYLGNHNLLPPNVLVHSDFESRFILSFMMNSSLIFVVCALTDLIGEKAQTEKEEMKLKAFQLRQISSIGKLAASVSHEINNPLTVLLGYQKRVTKMLDNKTEFDRGLVEFYMQKIMDSVQRIKLVTSLMGTISEQEHSRVITKFNLIDVINEILHMRNEEITKKSISVKIAFEKNEYSFEGIYLEIFQAIFNIIENAIQELGLVSGERVLSIYSEENEKNSIIYIEDNGKGIPEGQREYVFEPFYYSDYTNIGKALGFSFSLNVFHTNGGNLELLSEVGKGTIFKLILPKTIPE